MTQLSPPLDSSPASQRAGLNIPLKTLPPQRAFAETKRPGWWWIPPMLTFLGFSTFIVYSTWAAFQGKNYEFGPYLSPFYSPLLWDGDVRPGEAVSHHAWFGQGPPAFWPTFLPFSAALLILWAPGGFRFTCYYYRGAYYKAFWADPPNCAVGEPRKSYLGENSFPLIIQNIHRYFLYLALLFIVMLAYDVILATRFHVAGTDRTEFGLGLGTLVLLVNVILLSSYTLGCHSFRHLIGGFRDRLSGNKPSYAAYNCVTCLNKRHGFWAWCSLFSVGFADLYVRLCAMGVWTDWRIV